MKRTISPELLGIVTDTVTLCGVELYDIDFKGKMLRVLISKPDGISVNDCASVSEKLSQRLDIDNVIRDRYFLEVSSPGIERKLRNRKDFEEIIGYTVSVSTHSGHYIGELLSVTESGINIKNTAGSSSKADIEQFILYTDINHAKRLISNEELFKKSKTVSKKQTNKSYVSHGINR